jgi:hypothetical protein
MRKSKNPKDENDLAEQEFERRVRERHIELFPEEYDHMFDSNSEARERRKGMSPMNREHLDATNRRRMAMGFAPLSASGLATNSETFEYVSGKMRAGEDVVLPDVEDAPTETAPLVGQPPSGSRLSNKIAKALASDAFLSSSDDRNEPDIIAVRLLGILFELNPHGSNEKVFDAQIRKILPGKEDAEYRRLHRIAMNEWMDAYGY